LGIDGRDFFHIPPQAKGDVGGGVLWKCVQGGRIIWDMLFSEEKGKRREK